MRIRFGPPCNCNTSARPLHSECSDGPYGLHKFHSFSLSSKLKNPAQCPGRRWAGRRGESLIVVDAAPWASGRPSVGVGPTNRFRYCRDGISDRWEPLARMARRSLIPLTVPSQSASAPIQSSAIHIHRARPRPSVRPSVVMVGIKLFDNALFAQENCA